MQMGSKGEQGRLWRWDKAGIWTGDCYGYRESCHHERAIATQNAYTGELQNAWNKYWWIWKKGTARDQQLLGQVDNQQYFLVGLWEILVDLRALHHTVSTSWIQIGSFKILLTLWNSITHKGSYFLLLSVLNGIQKSYSVSRSRQTFWLGVQINKTLHCRPSPHKRSVISCHKHKVSGSRREGLKDAVLGAVRWSESHWCRVCLKIDGGLQ